MIADSRGREFRHKMNFRQIAEPLKSRAKKASCRPAILAGFLVAPTNFVGSPRKDSSSALGRPAPGKIIYAQCTCTLASLPAVR